MISQISQRKIYINNQHLSFLSNVFLICHIIIARCFFFTIIILFYAGPSKSMKIIISDNVRACVANGNEYPLGHPFSFVDRCFKYNCECHSNGSWECPANRAEYKCGDETERNFTRVETTILKSEFVLFRTSFIDNVQNKIYYLF